MVRNVTDELLDTYCRVAESETLSQRLTRGNNADFRRYGQDANGATWLLKTDKPGREMVAWEFDRLVELAPKGLVPPVAEDRGVFGYPEGFLIRCVDNGATLEDYVAGYAAAQVSQELLEQLFAAVGDLLHKFWYDLEWVHGDLHLKNIVVGVDLGGTEWHPCIIDLATSYSPDTRQKFAEQYCMIAEDLLSWKDDMERFSFTLENFGQRLGLEDNKGWRSALFMLDQEL